MYELDKDTKESITNSIETHFQNEIDSNKEKEFHSNRIIFYFDNKTGDIRFPDSEYQNCSHVEWFNNIKVDIEKVIRGFRKGYNIYLYIGRDFKVPNLTTEQYLKLKYIFGDVWDIYLGMKIGKIGEVWEPIKSIKITQE